MDLGLRDKVAVITGGSDGIGKATAIAMVHEGAKVAIAARDKDNLHSAYKDIAQQTKFVGRVITVPTDVTIEKSVKNMTDTVIEQFGKIDILVNNAGTSSASKFEDMTNQQVIEDIQLKVFGAIYCTRHTIKWLKKSVSGVIVNITTPGGKAPLPESQPTSLSRAAGISLTKTWSKEFAKYNIRVNTVCVGLIKSGQHRNRWQKINAAKPEYTLEHHWHTLGESVTLGRVGEANEAGEVIAFICSERASYITGASINVDGGNSPVV